MAHTVRAMRAAWIGLALSGSALGAPADDLDACAAHLPPQVRGILRIERECPAVEPALAASGLTRAVGGSARDGLDARGLRDLAAAARRFASTAPSPPPGRESLRGVLASLDARPHQSTGLWDLIRAWFATHRTSLQWLDRLIEGIGNATAVWSWAAYTLLALLGAAIALAIVRELRGRSRPGAADPPGTVRAITTTAQEAWGQGHDDASSIRVRELLRRLVGRLCASGRLPSERSLTYRELIARCELEPGSRHAAFASVALAAEASLYDRRPPDEGRLAVVIGEGEALLAEIERLGAP